MKSNVQMKMTSKKQLIRLWFECLQICHSEDEYKDNLKNSFDFYSEWGDVQNIKFDDWWKTHKHLFEDMNVREVKKVNNHRDFITLSIPLTQKVSHTIKEVKELVETRQTERLIELGIDPRDQKSKNLQTGKYNFTQKEMKGVFQYINLEVFKIFLSLGKPPINRNFLMEVRKSFDSRPKSLLKRTVLNLPSINQFETQFTTNGDCEDLIRSYRRSVKSVQNTLLNVSQGKFP